MNSQEMKVNALLRQGNQQLRRGERSGGEKSARSYVAAGKIFGAALQIDRNNVRALKSWAYALVSEASFRSMTTRSDLLTSACQKYAAILKHSPGDWETEINLATAYTRRARVAPKGAADPLYAAAEACYLRALAFKPGEVKALAGWGRIVVSRSLLKSGHEALQRFEDAYKTMPRAFEREVPGVHLWHSWGKRLTGSAELAQGARRAACYGEAIQKYDNALRFDRREPYILNEKGKAFVKLSDCEGKGNSDERLKAAAGCFALALKRFRFYRDARFNWACVLVKQAERVSGNAAESLYASARSHFLAILRRSPGWGDGLYRWSLVSIALAKMKPVGQSDAIFEQVTSRIRQRIRIRPRNSWLRDQLAWALGEWAIARTGALADRLFAHAVVQYSASIQLRRKSPWTLNAWGHILCRWAETKKGPDAARLYAEACKKFSRTFSQDAKHDLSLYNWGIALFKRAQLSSGKKRERFLVDACKKYAASLKTKPLMVERVTQWGRVLAYWARNSGEEEKRSRVVRFQAAIIKCEEALALDSRSWAVNYEMGNLLIELAQLVERRRASRNAARGCTYLEVAVASRPSDADTRYWLGRAYWLRSRLADKTLAGKYLAAAESHLEAAIKMRPNDFWTLRHSGDVLVELANLGKSMKAARLFGDACLRYEGAAKLYPRNKGNLEAWSEALKGRSRLSSGREAGRFVKLSEEKFKLSRSLN